MFQRIKHLFMLLRLVPSSIYFNFKYLPVKQAIKIPIFIYKPDFQRIRGEVKITANHIFTGMIRLGMRSTCLFPNNGIMWNVEGRVVFKGTCSIGNDSNILCGASGKITFGENFIATGGVRIASYRNMTFGDNVLIGWGSVILDTDFHPLYDINKGEYKKACGDVFIGDSNWFACYCTVLNSVTTPENCVFGARSLVTRSCNYLPNSLYVGNPVKLVKQGVRLDVKKRSIDY